MHGSVADHDQAHPFRKVSKHGDEAVDRFARNKTTDRDDDDVAFGEAPILSPRIAWRRPFDTERDSDRREFGRVERPCAAGSILGLGDDAIGTAHERSDPPPQQRVPVRRCPFARIIEITAMNRQDVGTSGLAREQVSDRPRWQGKVGIDDIRPETLHDLTPAPDSLNGKPDQGDHARSFEMPPEGYGHTVDRYAVSDFLGREIETARRNDRDFMAPGQFLGQHRRDHAAATANRRILVIADENPHRAMHRKSQRKESPPAPAIADSCGGRVSMFVSVPTGRHRAS